MIEDDEKMSKEAMAEKHRQRIDVLKTIAVPDQEELKKLSEEAGQLVISFSTPKDQNEQTKTTDHE